MWSPSRGQSPHVDGGGELSGRNPGSVVAALTAVALGTFAMVVFTAGNHRWDGAILFEVLDGHGIHASDLLGLFPFAAGILLAAWCLRRGRRPEQPTHEGP